MRLAVVVVCLLALFGFISLLDIVFKPSPKPPPAESIVKTTKIERDWYTVEFEGRRFLMFNSGTYRCAIVELK